MRLLRAGIVLSTLLTVVACRSQIYECPACAGPHATVDLTAVVDKLPKGTTARLCAQPTVAEHCDFAQAVARHATAPPSAYPGPTSSTRPFTADPYTADPSGGYVVGVTQVSTGLGAAALHKLSLILTSPGRPPVRIAVTDPKTSWGICACGRDRDSYRYYSYRLLAADGPLIPAES